MNTDCWLCVVLNLNTTEFKALKYWNLKSIFLNWWVESHLSKMLSFWLAVEQILIKCLIENIKERKIGSLLFRQQNSRWTFQKQGVASPDLVVFNFRFVIFTMNIPFEWPHVFHQTILFKSGFDCAWATQVFRIRDTLNLKLWKHARAHTHKHIHYTSNWDTERIIQPT